METKTKLIIGGVFLLTLIAIAGAIWIKGQTSKEEINSGFVSAGTYHIGQPPPNNPHFNISLEENVSYEFTHGNKQIKIGKANTTRSGIEIYKWGESSMKIVLPQLVLDNMYETPEGAIIVNHSNFDAIFYMINNKSFEWEVVLKSRPAQNSIDFPVILSNLDCTKQLPLDEEMQGYNYSFCNATHCFLEGENLTRPERVVNSYACYHTNKSGNEYEIGKALHIYRIKVIDSLGDSIWGEMDISGGTMEITLDRTWLRNAEYPVTIDPIFGYDTIGGSNQALTSNTLCSRFDAPEDGTVTQVVWYHNDAWNKENLNLGYYTHDSGEDLPYQVVATSGRGDLTLGDGQWYWFNQSVSGSISNGVTYWLCGFGTARADNQYDTSGGYRTVRAQSVEFEDPWVTTTSAYNNRIVSIYANYTTGAGGDCWIISAGKLAIPPTCKYQLNVGNGTAPA
ncbi:MAG: hypothetical protein JSW08_00025 [archaeon]|nr:MAG: hypothetical protein JSW08_00025 [archaeon]